MVLQLQRDSRGYGVKEGVRVAGDPHACVRLTSEQRIYTGGFTAETFVLSGVSCTWCYVNLTYDLKWQERIWPFSHLSALLQTRAQSLYDYF